MTYLVNYYSVTGNLVMEVDGRSITIRRRGEGLAWDQQLGQFVIPETHDLCPAEESVPETAVGRIGRSSRVAPDGGSNPPQRRECADPFEDFPKPDWAWTIKDYEKWREKWEPRIRELREKWDAISVNNTYTLDWLIQKFSEGEEAQHKLKTVCEIMKVICEEMDCDNRPVEDVDYCEAQKCPIWRLRSALEGEEAAEG